MPTASRRRKKITRASVPTPGKDSWQIVGPEGEIIRDFPYGEGATLNAAQLIAHKYRPEDVTLTLIVRLKALFGEPDDLFRVVREEDRSVSTYRV